MVPIKKGNMVSVGTISGPNQRPTLSGLLGAGMVATTIQVNTISGVAGFVLPEERVDVILNRLINGRRTAEVILENLRVLAVDSIVDPQSGKPVPARSVTFEINRDQAQKLTVAASLGEITLALRAANSDSYSQTGRISDADIGPARPGGDAPVAQVPSDGNESAIEGGSQIDSSTVDTLKKEIDDLKQSATTSGTTTGDATETTPSDLKNMTVIRGLNRDIQAVPAR
jgi:pilus assembly protein CpaB